jgi:serine/threonine protein kinase
MAPEQVKGDPMDQRTDIYAVGITAYEMLVGKRPFPDDDVHVLEDMHLSHEIPDPAASVPNLLPDLQRFIIKSCQRDPNLRYDNFKQALADLKRIGSQLEVDSKSLAATKRKQTTLMLSFEDKSKKNLAPRSASSVWILQCRICPKTRTYLMYILDRIYPPSLKLRRGRQDYLAFIREAKKISSKSC